MPPGATQFASRQYWGRQVAYSSQFQPWYDRALNKAQALRARLGGPDWAAFDELDPPKPKRMRLRTYERITLEAHRQEAIADQRLFFLVNQWMKLG